MSSGARRPSAWGVHPRLEVIPTCLSSLDIGLRDLAGVLAQHVQEDNEVSGPAVKNPVELRPIVAAQLAQRAADLA